MRIDDHIPGREAQVDWGSTLRIYDGYSPLQSARPDARVDWIDRGIFIGDSVPAMSVGKSA
jgi:hypothetical protein